VVKARELMAASVHLPHPGLANGVAKASQQAISRSWSFTRDEGCYVLVAPALANWAQSRPLIVEEESAVY
jgi:hypothetical protein